MFPVRRPRMDFNGPPSRMHFGSSRMEFNRPPFRYPPCPCPCPPQMRMNFNESGMRMDWDSCSDYSARDDEYLYNKPPMKVHCGQLREHHAGLEVEISGKIHKQRLGRFLTLKDANGMTQCIVPDDKPYLIRRVTNMPVDSYIVLFGTVSRRPRNQRNAMMKTGSIEVTINKIQAVHAYRNGKDSSKSMSMLQIRQTSSCANSLGVTSEEFKRCATSLVSKKFSNRTHNCGELNTIHKGMEVTLCGWIETNQGRFIQLRDGYGLVQTVVPTGNDEISAIVTNIKPDTLVQISGQVCLRPESQINSTISSGQIEVQIQSVKLITADESSEANSENISPKEDVSSNLVNNKIDVNSFTTRTYNCNQLRNEHIGEVVTLCGWLEFHRVGKFVILRDGYGRTQLIIPEENKKMQQEIDKLPHESILQVTGVVTSRPPGSEQPNMSTGRIEVVIQQLKVLNSAVDKLPFNLREFNKAKEALRMQYRYLDLRYLEMQRNLRTRSRLLMDMRDFLVNQADFVDVETPTLFKATPGGAQEFVVPTRFPGQFYSLVQSPQQFKQMLMVGAIDRYFQIARCYRDESARTDRQPEFTQLDIEMSFTNVDGVINLSEQLLKHCWPKHISSITVPFQKITYYEALDIYGSDKPDLTIETKLIDCTEILRSNSELVGDEQDFIAKALVFKKPFTDLTNAVKNRYSTQFSIAHPQTKLIQQKFFKSKTNEWIASISKLFGETIPNTLIDHLHLHDDCVLFLAYGNKIDTCLLLGKIRTDFVNHLEERGHAVRLNNNEMNFIWVVDFPLFEKNQNSSLSSVHHPFTAPHPDDIKFLTSEPLKVRSLAYDLVLNGNEIAGGSIRIHDVNQQKLILDKLQIPENSMKHLLEALASGCPPHGGIAFGLDRLLSLILKTKSIRDVIAFPKSIEGRDPLSGAPVPISAEDKKLYHIQEFQEDNVNDTTVYFDSNTSLNDDANSTLTEETSQNLV